MEHIKLYKALQKLAAYNTVEEYNQIQSYGNNADSGWIDEGDLPTEQDATYERKHSIVKYLGIVKRVTHVMSLVRPAHGNVVAQETINGTMSLLEIIERALFFADSGLSSLQFDGFDKLIEDSSPAHNTFDLRGKPLSEDILSDMCLVASDSPNYGRISDIYANPRVVTDLIKTFFPKERHGTFSDKSGMIGADVRGFVSPAGNVRFNPNVFIDDHMQSPHDTAIGDATKRPGIPTVTGAAAVANDAASQFAADDTGDYWYYFEAVNRYGRSAKVLADAGAVTVSAGEKMTVGVTPGAGGDVLWYELYRGRKNAAAADARKILRVKNTTGAAQMLLVDYNANLPHTSTVFGFQQNLENMSLKSLGPMLKIPLATIDTSIRWAQVAYMTPVLYTPGKNIRLKNCGLAAGAFAR